MKKRNTKRKIHHRSPTSKFARAEGKVKKKRKPMTWSDIFVLIFCLILFAGMILIIYEHMMLLE